MGGLLDNFFGVAIFILSITMILLMVNDFIRITISSFVDRKHKIPTSPRQEANLKILAQLLEYVEKHPDQRFGQVLRSTGVAVDIGVRDSSQEEWETPDYYWARGVFEESIATLARMELNKRGLYTEINVIDKRKKL